MSYEPPFAHSDASNTLCMEISELVGQISPQAPLAQSVSLHRDLRIKTIHSSLLIEGNQLDERSVTAVLDGKRVLGDQRDILEVQNAQRAYNLLPDLDPYSLPDLLDVHFEMMNGLISDAGCFRSGNVGVFNGDALIHTGTPAAYVPQVMADIFSWLGTTNMHPLLASCVFHFEFEFCHPFSDGNGRTGRLWQTLLLSRWRPMLAWLPVESTIRQHQQDYYRALAQSGAAGSSEKFVLFMLEAIKESLLPFAHPETSKEQAELRALAFFEENPLGNIPQLAQHLQCSQRSAERLVAQLKTDGKLKRKGTPRAGKWIVTH